MHDDYMEENAKFRSDAGLKCWIVRTTDGKCCSWCTSIAGRYEYGKEPQSVYRRHDNCGCTVTYENGRQRQDVWSKRTWESDQPTPARVEPTRLTGAQGRETEQRSGEPPPAIVADHTVLPCAGGGGAGEEFAARQFPQ